jgi:hypothetical protein
MHTYGTRGSGVGAFLYVMIPLTFDTNMNSTGIRKRYIYLLHYFFLSIAFLLSR